MLLNYQKRPYHNIDGHNDEMAEQESTGAREPKDGVNIGHRHHMLIGHGSAASPMTLRNASIKMLLKCI